MRKGVSHSPVIYDYLKKYQEDPTSRVFAPLAEAYRKAGMIKEAVEIAREGLRVHPGFTGGRVALARALFDQGEYQQVVDELSAIIQDVPDNLVAQRVLAESYLLLGRLTDALGSYKMYLYFNPADEETYRLVQELEAQAYEQGTLVLRSDPTSSTGPSIGGMDQELPTFDVRSASEAISSALPVDSPEMQAEKRNEWVHRVEFLQGLLLKVERYRILYG